MKTKWGTAACLWVLIMVLMLFAACGAEMPEPTEALPTETVAVTEATEPTEVVATEPEKIPFEDYEYLYTEERDRAWEEDVVFLAKAFLGVYPMNGHPLLVDKDIGAWKPNNYIEVRNFYQEDLHDGFVVDLVNLIQDIPVLSDTEIVYEMKRTVAKLSDLHSYVYLPVSEVFVFMVEPFYSDKGMELRVVQIPAEYQDALYGKLVAINGVSIDEVIDRLSQYISHEWEYGKMFYMTNPYYTGVIIRKEALQVAGIVGVEETAAKLEIITEQGEHVIAEVSAVEVKEYKDVEIVCGDWIHDDLCYYKDYQNVNYFLRYEEESQMLYIRFNRVVEMNDYRFSAFFEDIQKQVSDNNCKKIVVDLRTNSGGNAVRMHQDFIETLSKTSAEQIYVLIDPSSYSEAIWLPIEIKLSFPNAVILGTPGGQSPNFFASSVTCNLPNSGHLVAVSAGCFLGHMDYEYETLMPDITVYQTLEDYKQGIDTVLEYVRNAN